MTVLAAVGESGISSRVLEVGHDLAAAYDDQLVVLHVIPEEDAQAHFARLREIPEFEDVSIEFEEERAREVAGKIIDNSSQSVDLDRVIARGAIGEPTDSILTLGEELDASYVVIGGRQRSPAGKVLFGSVTQSVLLNADRPVVTVMEE